MPLVAKPGLKKKGFSEPDWQDIGPISKITDADIQSVFDKPIYKEIIVSDAFQRLKEIRFLGAIDYVIRSCGVSAKKGHSRFQHSLGVAKLAIQYSRLCGLADSEEVPLVTAALLHDIGHAPLSHSLERTFKNRFGLNHHIASEKIIHGAVPLGVGLRLILKQHGIAPDRILRLIGGVQSEPNVEPFNSPINIDTVEAIIRSSSYIPNNMVDVAPSRVVLALVRKTGDDIGVMDNFWELKDTVYNQLITSKVGLLADFTCQKYMEEHRNIWEGMYFHSESQLRRSHPALFEELRKIKEAQARLGEKTLQIRYQRRRFIVDKAVLIRSPADMHKRYKQTRTDLVVEVKAPA